MTAADGNNHNRVLDPPSARYATVAHGANALTYGASTLGGAIDFTSPTARNSDPLSMFAQGGSHGQLNGRLTGGFTGETARCAGHHGGQELGRLPRAQRAGTLRTLRECRLEMVRPP